MSNIQDKSSKSKSKNEKIGQPKKKKFELFNVKKEDEKKEVALQDTTNLEHANASTTGHRDAIVQTSLETIGAKAKGVKSVQAVAADILGVSSQIDFSKTILPISKTEFRYCEFGVVLRFLKDSPKDKKNKRWMVINGQDTRRICVPAAYWLIDKLSNRTGESLFYSPGREGIRR